jgi:Fe-S-cluster containining protein
MESNQVECQRCGNCCISGGPALHSEDRRLVLEGHLPLAQLITIRKGELAYNPLSDTIQPVRRELVKISGVGREWNCYYFDPEQKGCTIYDMRPQACKALRCWDTEEVEALIETDTLERLDLLADDDPLRPLIVEHEQLFPCPDMLQLQQDGPGNRAAELEQRANDEIGYRAQAVQRFDLSLGEELFYFGRPLFHLFVSIGAEVMEVEGRLLITWKKPSRSTT